MDAVEDAARVTGPLILQYPLYGGIMGIMTTTGLAGVISKAFLAFSTGRTLPFWTYVSSLIITLFIPSGGGHWAVQGPFVLPAAKQLHSSFAGTTMAVAMGESVANMIQPFFALPILAIAGIPDAAHDGLYGHHVSGGADGVRLFVAGARAAVVIGQGRHRPHFSASLQKSGVNTPCNPVFSFFCMPPHDLTL